MGVEIALLVVLVSTLVLIATVAVPAIERGSLMPPQLVIEQPPDDDLTEAQRAYFQALDAELAALGYTPRTNIVAANLQGANLTRVYARDDAAAVLGATSLRAAAYNDPKVEASQNYYEWTTRFADGSTLTTRNVQATDTCFDLMPHKIVQDFPAVSHVAALKERHERRAQTLRARGPLPARGRDTVAELRDYHERWCRFQESRGLLRYDAGAAGYRVTAKTAWRQVLTFFNPVADNFTWLRLAAGLAFGAGLPLLAVWGTPHLEGPSWWLALFAGFGAGGAAIGWIFQGKATVWVLLLAYAPLRLLGAGFWPSVIFFLWMRSLAEKTCAWRHRRESLV
jgi:hypothetical protein